jgi:hypothetical protein
MLGNSRRSPNGDVVGKATKPSTPAHPDRPLLLYVASLAPGLQYDTETFLIQSL